MIISFKHKFVFIAISKTASHTFREALRPELGPRDWEQCKLFEKREFPVKALAAVGHGHFTYAEIKPYLLPGMWDEFFTFCTIRNPFDRFVSHCCFIYRGTEELAKDPVGLMKRVIDLPQHAGAFRPQTDYVFDAKERLVVDKACRFESLQSEFNEVIDRIGLKPKSLRHVNKSVHRPYQDYFDDELYQMVKQKYARDFHLLGYSSELG